MVHVSTLWHLVPLGTEEGPGSSPWPVFCPLPLVKTCLIIPCIFFERCSGPQGQHSSSPGGLAGELLPSHLVILIHSLESDQMLRDPEHGSSTTRKTWAKILYLLVCVEDFLDYIL